MLSNNASLIYGILVRAGALSASDLTGRAKLSQPSISRALSELGDEMPELFSFRIGRSIFYAIGRRVRSLPLRLPVYREGPPRELFGNLIALNGGYLFTGVDGGISHSRSLPWFMQDMRPQGYIGRAFCQAKAGLLGLPDRLQDWSDDDVIHALAVAGHDAHGNLVLFDAVPRTAAMFILEGDLVRSYDGLASDSLSGNQPGSSAGGEHPKFAISYQDGVGGTRHVIVKFSPQLDSPAAVRWKDLLIAEHLANEVLRENGFDAAVSRIIQSDTRCYLESERFDRSGGEVRVGVVSFGAIDDEFIGRRCSWGDSAETLYRDGMLDAESVERIRAIEAFGRQIGNTDMHFGNMSFYWRIEGSKPVLSLAPIYDMLPMLYAPEKGEIVNRRLDPPATTGVATRTMARVARQFWNEVADHGDISGEFKSIAKDNVARLSSALRLLA